MGTSIKDAEEAALFKLFEDNGLSLDDFNFSNDNGIALDDLLVSPVLGNNMFNGVEDQLNILRLEGMQLLANFQEGSQVSNQPPLINGMQVQQQDIWINQDSTIVPLQSQSNETSIAVEVPHCEASGVNASLEILHDTNLNCSTDVLREFLVPDSSNLGIAPVHTQINGQTIGSTIDPLQFQCDTAVLIECVVPDSSKTGTVDTQTQIKGQKSISQTPSHLAPSCSNQRQTISVNGEPCSLEETVDKPTAANSTKRKRGKKGQTSTPSKTKSTTNAEKKEGPISLSSAHAIRIEASYLDIPVLSKTIHEKVGCVILPDKEDQEKNVNAENTAIETIKLPKLDEILKVKGNYIRSDNTKKFVNKVLINLDGGLYLEMTEEGLYATRRCPAHIFWINSEQSKEAEATKLERDVRTLVFDPRAFEKKVLVGLQGKFSLMNNSNVPEPPLIWFIIAQKWTRGICPLKSMAIWAQVSPLKCQELVTWTNTGAAVPNEASLDYRNVLHSDV